MKNVVVKQEHDIVFFNVQNYLFQLFSNKTLYFDKIMKLSAKRRSKSSPPPRKKDIG